MYYVLVVDDTQDFKNMTTIEGVYLKMEDAKDALENVIEENSMRIDEFDTKESDSKYCYAYDMGSYDENHIHIYIDEVRK